MNNTHELLKNREVAALNIGYQNLLKYLETNFFKKYL
jgi:hypothetical protein